MNKNMELNNLRREYQKGGLSKNTVLGNPFKQFKIWLDEAIKLIDIEPTAMILSTVSKEGKPSSRIVLLKEFSENGMCFFTNYESRKAIEIRDNSNASILFFWKELERQIRIEGKIIKTDSKTSDGYFESRPYDSRISAIVSSQSKEVESRELLDDLFKIKKESLNENNPERPDYWGGYILKPIYFEYWQGRENRLHDRIIYEMYKDEWVIRRIAP